MEIDDHFDPLDFYSNDPLSSDQVTTDIATRASTDSFENTISQPSSSNNNSNNSNTLDKSANLRRSGRPKPSAESLISSPPAIKFYESTVIRKPSKPPSSSRSTALRNKNGAAAAGSAEESPVANSKVLKLRLAGPEGPATETETVIVENNNEKVLEMTTKRVVKLMMPDITEDGHSHQPSQQHQNQQSHQLQSKKSQTTSPVKNVKVLPLLAPKPPTGINQNSQVTESDFKLRERKPKRKQATATNQSDYKHVKDVRDNKDDKKRRKKHSEVIENSKDAEVKPANTTIKPASTTKPTSSTAITNTSTKPDSPLSQSRPLHIINEDICSSCGGLGNFICCDACPRSFHFTCAEPPLDPLDLPEDDWYCNECRQPAEPTNRAGLTESGDIWGLMIRKTERSNPKCFVMPRRFRYQPKEEDLIKLQTGQLFKSPSVTNTANTSTATAPPNKSSPSPPPPVSKIIINSSVKIDHCGYELVAPNIAALKSPSGYCHCCGRFGLTKAGLSKADEMAHVPGDPRYHRPMLSCTICPLYWHLDCLDTPLVSFPPPSLTWTCPIHFTGEHCIALEIAESLVQAATLLPESAVRLQFMRKAERIREQRQGDDDAVDDFEDEDEKMYGMSNCINVPENIKSKYQ